MHLFHHTYYKYNRVYQNNKQYLKNLYKYIIFMIKYGLLIYNCVHYNYKHINVINMKLYSYKFVQYNKYHYFHHNHSHFTFQLKHDKNNCEQYLNIQKFLQIYLFFHKYNHEFYFYINIYLLRKNSKFFINFIFQNNLLFYYKYIYFLYYFVYFVYYFVYFIYYFVYYFIYYLAYFCFYFIY